MRRLSRRLCQRRMFCLRASSCRLVGVDMLLVPGRLAERPRHHKRPHVRGVCGGLHRPRALQPARQALLREEAATLRQHPPHPRPRRAPRQARHAAILRQRPPRLHHPGPRAQARPLRGSAEAASTCLWRQHLVARAGTRTSPPNTLEALCLAELITELASTASLGTLRGRRR